LVEIDTGIASTDPMRQTLFLPFIFVVSSMLSGCSGVLTQHTSPSSPPDGEAIPIPRIGRQLASVVIPEGWQITCTGPAAGCEADYVLEPSSNPERVTIAISGHLVNSSKPKMTELQQAEDYLSGIRDVHDDKVTLKQIGSVPTAHGPVGLYLYYSAYWRYRVAAIRSSEAGYFMIEMYCPSEENLQRNRKALENTIMSFQITK
jgi:hypothetical protein